MRNIKLFLLLFLSGSLFAQTEHIIEVTSNQFTPSELTIQAGDIVTWNCISGAHNVNGTLDAFPDNPEGFGNDVGVNWTYSFTFNTPGTYDYKCDPHEFLGMVAQITVEESSSNSTVVINEISYNPPEGGTDSLEFVELYNFGNEAIDLSGWSFTEGFELTFEDGVTLDAGGYLIVAGNAAAFTNTFNYGGDVIEWTGGALTNGGEDIELSDANGSVVDYVEYDDNLPWPTEPDGDGASLVLCDPLSDNNTPLAWQAASTSAGFSINDIEVFANPGAESGCVALEPIAYWLDNFISEDEDAGTVNVGFVIQNIATSGEVVELSIGAGSTATSIVDFFTLPPLPNMYGSDAVAIDTIEFELTVIDDSEIEDDEVIEFVLEGLNGVTIAEPVLQYTIRDNDSEVVVTPIDDINDIIDETGVAVSLGETVTLQGVVSCLDLDGNNGYGFFMNEPATGDGIYVFSSSDVDDYQLTPGDEIQVTGDLAQFRGLLQIVPVSITIISTDNDLPAIEAVNTVNESTESRYIELALSTETPTTDFITVFGNGSMNVTAVAASNDTVTVRIDETTGIDSTFIADFFIANAANGIFVTGYGGQFDGFDAPFLSGYQILPCSEDDFDNVSSTSEPLWASELKVYPNPVQNLLTAEVPVQVEQYRLIDGLGRSVLTGLVQTNKLQLDLNQAKAGVYYLQLFSKGEVVTRPVVKQ